MKNAMIGFMFVMCALLGFNNYGAAQEYVVPGSVTYTYSAPMYGTPTYNVPVVVQQNRPTPVRNVLSNTVQTVQNRMQGVQNLVQGMMQPQYVPTMNTNYGQTYVTPQPRYQQVTETRYRKVCRGRSGCSYQPYTYTYMKRVQ